MPDDQRLQAWGAAHTAWLDAAVPVVVLCAFEMPAFDPYRHAGGAAWAMWGLIVAVPLWWRRRRPVLVLAASLLGATGAVLTRSGPDWGGLSVVALLLGPAVALATASARLPTRQSQILALSCAAVVVATSAERPLTPDWLSAQLVVLVTAWLAGEALRARHSEIALLRDRAARAAEQATNAERGRIARELHDAVAHQLCVIAVHAGAARLSAGEQAPARASLLTIEEASRLALTDLRRALGVLRHDQPYGIAPQPRLAQLDQLATRLRDAGVPLQLTVSGTPADVPDGVAVSVYRIVQEALTNVVNHAGGAPTVVEVRCDPAEVRLQIRNDRPGPDGPAGPPGTAVGGGHGLIGMHERVAAYGGWLEAGALPTGGFQVRARIPLS